MDRHQARHFGSRRGGTAVRGRGIMAIYAKIKGRKQGDIKGGVTTQAFDGQIHLDSCEFGLAAPYDVATGQASGRRVPRPVHLVKQSDRTSPLLYMACVTNEVLDVEISYTEEGAEHKSLMTIVLTNAMIRDFNHLGGAKGSAVEKLSLTYTKFEFTDVQAKTMASDDWSQAT